MRCGQTCTGCVKAIACKHQWSCHRGLSRMCALLHCHACEEAFAVHALAAKP